MYAPTSAVKDLFGRPPRSFDEWVQDHAALKGVQKEPLPLCVGVRICDSGVLKRTARSNRRMVSHLQCGA
jgi:hypothetical protein